MGGNTSERTATHLPPLGAHVRDDVGHELRRRSSSYSTSRCRQAAPLEPLGPPFRPLHERLDELVDSWRELYDTVAERAVAIGFSPDGQAPAIADGSWLRPVERGPIEDHAVVAT